VVYSPCCSRCVRCSRRPCTGGRECLHTSTVQPYPPVLHLSSSREFLFLQISRLGYDGNDDNDPDEYRDADNHRHGIVHNGDDYIISIHMFHGQKACSTHSKLQVAQLQLSPQFLWRWSVGDRLLVYRVKKYCDGTYSLTWYLSVRFRINLTCG
jgi:hypothetical protein